MGEEDKRKTDRVSKKLEVHYITGADQKSCSGDRPGLNIAPSRPAGFFSEGEGDQKQIYCTGACRGSNQRFGD
jgi:hypothetical protein